VLLNERVKVILFIDFARECNIIFLLHRNCFLLIDRLEHLLNADEGNMKMYSPTSIIFPSGVALREYDDTLG
jgi:hypothetical protein